MPSSKPLTSEFAAASSSLEMEGFIIQLKKDFVHCNCSFSV